MKHKKRLMVILVILLLVAVLGIFTEVTRYRGHRICGYCGSTQVYETTSYYMLGREWENADEGLLTASRFLVDYPDHQCNHAWTHYSGESSHIWNSPLLVSFTPDKVEFYVSRSIVVEAYVASERFRVDVNQLVSEGKISRVRLMEIAGINCMDGGTCVLDREVDEDRWLLEVIDEYEAEQVAASDR